MKVLEFLVMIFGILIVMTIAIDIFIEWFICIRDSIKLFFSLKKEKSTLKEKNLHWKDFHISPYNSRVESIVKYFISHKEKVSYKLSGNKVYFMKICTKNRALYVWVSNKWSGYANIIKVCKTDPEHNFLYSCATYENCRPSYHTMCQLIELEKQC